MDTQTQTPTINTNELRSLLDEKAPVIVLDVRPQDQRDEWRIPGSTYIDAYQKLNVGDEHALDEFSAPQNSKVVTICAAGRISQIAANLLIKKGYDAVSLEGGMKAWSMAWNTAEMNIIDDSKLIQVRRTGKGCLSYILASKGNAMIIDPSLEAAAYEAILEKHNLTLISLLETHVHADHLSRAKLLADKYQVPLRMPELSKVQFAFTPVADGDLIKLNDIAIKAIHSPGHTPESMCYLINDKILLTGDTLFLNSVGRPDLKADTEQVKLKAKMLYASLHKLIQLNEGLLVLPAHTSQPVEFDNRVIKTTLADIIINVSILHLEESQFIDTILQRIPPTPPNYLTIAETNIKGNYTDVNPVELEAGANRCAIS